MDVSFEPRALVESGGALRLNATYYLTKVIIPALHRLFSLVGADIWVRPPPKQGFRALRVLTHWTPGPRPLILKPMFMRTRVPGLLPPFGM